MKGRQIALDHIGGREAAALIVDGRLEDLLIDADDHLRIGSIYRAIAARPMKGQGGMMLDTPDGTVFFRHAKGLRPGQGLLVQVTGRAEPGKAAPVTDRIIFKSRYAIVTPLAPGFNLSRTIRDEAERDRLQELAHRAMESSPYGVILRSAASGAEAETISEDIAAARTLAEDVMAGTATGDAARLSVGDGPHILAWRDWVEPAEILVEDGSFEELGVLAQLDDLKSPKVPLSGGAFLFVEPTRALIAVDVNTGTDTSPAASLKANLAAARALPRQLRLRGLGGQVTLDFAPVTKAHRREVEQALRAAFKTDPIETALVGWTPLGHFELQRKRERIPLEGALI